MMAYPGTPEWCRIAAVHDSHILRMSRNQLAEALGNGMHVGCAAAVIMIAGLFVHLHTPAGGIKTTSGVFRRPETNFGKVDQAKVQP